MKVVLFGSYLHDKNANDVDIAIVTKYITRKSIIGKIIRRYYIKKLSTKFNKPLHLDIYSEKYLDECEKSDRLTIKKDRILKISDLKKAIYGGVVYESTR